MFLWIYIISSRCRVEFYILLCISGCVDESVVLYWWVLYVDESVVLCWWGCWLLSVNVMLNLIFIFYLTIVTIFMWLSTGSSFGFSCFSEEYRGSAKRCARFSLLALCLVTGIVTVGYSGLHQDSPLFLAIYTNSLPCFVVYVLSLIPDACHESAKVNVKSLCVFLGIVTGITLSVNEAPAYGIGLSIIIGSFYSGLTWISSAFLCTNEFRKALLDSSPCVAKCCPFLVDDSEDEPSYHINQIGPTIVVKSD